MAKEKGGIQQLARRNEGVSGVRSRPKHRETKRQAPVKTYFHRTTEAAATAIIRNGFKYARGKYLSDTEHQGVWLSDTPVDCNEGA